MIKRIIGIFTTVSFLLLGILPYENVFAQEDLFLPPAGQLLPLSSAFTPLMIKGLKIHKNNPFEFDFIINQGEENLPESQFKEESLKLIKYFLASLTIPENDLWVNLSPYEKNRITTPELGITGMGRDLLSQDYVLKQLTSSLIYPEGETGKKFWSKVYALAQEKYHTTNVPIDTFNKVWIVPQKAVVYENAANQTAYVIESKLKVMLEEDYLALQKHSDIQKNVVIPDSSVMPQNGINSLGSEIVRDVVIPELTKEVNTGRNFANLRQITNSLILAAWFKRALKASILAKLYVDQKKMAGVNLDDTTIKERIFQQYLRAYKKGVYNYIKEEQDPISHEIVPRKYFSGGVVEKFDTSNFKVSHAMTNEALKDGAKDRAVTVKLRTLRSMVKEYLAENEGRLPYGSVDGPPGLASKLASYTRQRLGLNFSDQQVLVSPSAGDVTMMLERIVKDGKIKTVNAGDYKSIETFRLSIGADKPSMIHLTESDKWDKNLVYQIWRYAVNNKILLFIEENSKQRRPQADPIEEAIVNGQNGGEFVLRYLSLSSVKKWVRQDGFGVLLTHNEGLLNKIKPVIRNTGYMNLDVLAMHILLKSLPDTTSSPKKPIVLNPKNFQYLADPDADYHQLGPIYINGPLLKKLGALNTHIGATDIEAAPWLIEEYINAASGKSGTRVELTDKLKNAIVKYLRTVNDLNYEMKYTRLGSGVKPLLTDTIVAIRDKTLAEGKKKRTRLYIPTATWASYFEMGEIAGVEIVEIKEEDLTQEFLDSLNSDPETQDILMLTNPHNPKSKIYGKRQLSIIGRWALKNNVYIISDEIYKELIRLTSRKKFTSIASLDLGKNPQGLTIQDLTPILSGITKTWGAAGPRLGYVAFTAKSGLDKYIKSSTQPTMGAMGAAYAIYSNPQRALKFATEHAQIIFTKLSKPVRMLLTKYGIKYHPMEAAFYVFPDLRPLYGKIWTAPDGTRTRITAKNLFGINGLFIQATSDADGRRPVGAVFMPEQERHNLRIGLGHRHAKLAAPKIKKFFNDIGLTPKRDSALISRTLDPGGIDLNTSNIDFEIKRDAHGFPLSIQYQHLENIHINGLRPIIIKDVLIPNLSEFLGATMPSLAHS